MYLLYSPQKTFFVTTSYKTFLSVRHASPVIN